MFIFLFEFEKQPEQHDISKKVCSNLHASCLVRLVHHVQLVSSAQTLQAHPLNAHMGLTAWVMQPLA